MSQSRKSVSRHSGSRNTPQQPDSAESAATSTMPPPAPRRQSTIFTKHFTKIPIEGDNNNWDVICNYCSASFKFKRNGGYGTFHQHMERNHPVEWGLDRQQQQLQGNPDNATELFKFNHNEYLEGQVQILCLRHLPFSHNEDPSVHRIVNRTLQPSAKRLTRHVLKRALVKLYKEQKSNLKNYFKHSNGKYSICCDIWSDHWQTNSYMGVTCHWVDENFFIQKRLIAYRVFNEAHTAANIAMLLKIIFQEFSIENKIFSISFDNATSNTASIPELERSCKPSFGGKFFHIRCAAHILNLCVQDGLKNLNTLLDPIRNAINLIWTYSSIRRQWKKFCKENGKRPKSFPKDVTTRWNSTYRLLNECYEYKDLLSTFLFNNYRQYYFETNQWNHVYKLLNLLQTFNLATERLSGVYYATSHLVLPELVSIGYDLKMLHTDPIFTYSSVLMKIKLCKYFTDIPLLNLVATVLDPRIKIDGIEEYLETYYASLKFDNIDESDDMYSSVLGAILEITSNLTIKNVNSTILDIRAIILEMLVEFGSSVGGGGSSGGSGSGGGGGGGSTSGGGILGLGRTEVMLERIMKKPKQSYNPSVEFDLYLANEYNRREYPTQNLDVLKWWHDHATQYPVLSLVARAIFGSPVSTVAVEQAFSAGGNMLTPQRSMMLPDSVEAQLCVEDWTRAEDRSQMQAHLEEFDQFDLSSEGSQGSEGTQPGGSDTEPSGTR